MPRILVVGRTGQLGTALAEALPATSWPHHVMEAPELDLTDAASIAAAVAATQPELVINAAAYTAVDAAENNIELAHAINATGPGLLAEAAARAEGFSRLELAATLSGEPLYRAYGFETIEPFDAVTSKGVAVPLIRMGKAVANG
jgi:nucleoside-diphosphate-sugar epimerase